MTEELEKKTYERSVLVPFLVGGIVGAGIALLLAPKSGKDLRKDIRDVASSTRDRVGATIEQGKNLYQEGTTAVREAIDAGKHAFVEEREKHLKAI